MDEQREQAIKTAISLAAPRYPLLGMRPASQVYTAVSELAAGQTDDESAYVAARTLILESRRFWGECKA